MRLTERKVCFPSCDKQGNLTSVDYIEIKNKNLAEEKLCQLEDIEDELGIDLIIFLKALTHGFYYKNKDSISTMSPDEIALGEGGFSRKEWEGDTIWFFKDYGKTWALTKEELL